MKSVKLPQVVGGVMVMEVCNITFKYTVPCATGVLNLSLGLDSRGIAVERGHITLLDRLDKQSKGDGLEAKLADERLERMQIIEMNSPKDLRSVNKCKLDASDLDAHVGKSPPVSKLFRIIGFTKQAKENRIRRTYTAMEKDARITPFSLSPFEVSARTGFSDVALLLSFILLVCNGDIEFMTRRVSELTWYEEWFMYFEFVWTRSITNIKTAMAAFGIKDHKIAKRVINSKLRLVLHARKQWPKYVSLMEDAQLCGKKWDAKYNGKILIFWDTTGIKLYQPQNALLQRLTYSAYYAGNVAKGGVFLQLCGWLGTHELYPGAMSDSGYLNETGIFEEHVLSV